MRRGAPLLILPLIALGVGCAPEPGGICKRESHHECTTDAGILVCEEGRWVDIGHEERDGDQVCRCAGPPAEDLEYYCYTLN